MPDYLNKTTKDFLNDPAARGTDLLGRNQGLHDWLNRRRKENVWPYSRALMGPPTAHTTVQDELHRETTGINYASQDYLGLSSHDAVKLAAIEAILEYGPHSAGSGMLLGNTRLSLELEDELRKFLKLGEEGQVLLFPTGWGAGFGAITGVAGPTDYVVFDELAHACLQEGAKHTTLPPAKPDKDPTPDGDQRRFKFEHLNHDDARKKLRAIRRHDTQTAILVVTEGLFSMDADRPDLRALQEICQDEGATLLVDVAHDLGSMGPGGTGTIGEQGMLEDVDLIMGSFSKTFASNGGFLASRSAPLRDSVKLWGSPHIFSNQLSPVQAAVVLKTLEIVQSSEGEKRRKRLMQAVDFLRTELANLGQLAHVLGEASPIVPVELGHDGQRGDQRLARLTSKHLCESESQPVLVNLVEFPAVNPGSARFRFQVMPSHTQADAHAAQLSIGDALSKAQHELDALVPKTKKKPKNKGKKKKP